jgi:hypothetical protein
MIATDLHKEAISNSVSCSLDDKQIVSDSIHKSTQVVSDSIDIFR